LTIGVREFLEKCPKSLTVRRDGDAVSVEVGIWPATMSNPFWFGQGTQISTELALVPHEAITPEQRASRLAAVRQPLCATLTPEEYCRAGVFWEVTPAKQSRWPVYDRHVAKAFQTICQDCTAYGIEDWGDAFVPGGPYVRGMTKLWINNEHDLCAALVSQFARTGEIAYLERAKPLARHVVNADVIRCHEKKAWIGGVYQHSPGMEVGHQVDSPRFSHAGWPLGMLWVYYLTGDESLKDICSLADYIVANLPDVAQVLMREERDCGYPLVTLCSIYDLTRNPKHLDAAHRIVDYVLRCQNPKTGGWTRPIYETPPYRGSTSSFANTLCRGLDYYLSLTGDSRVRDCLERAGAWVAADTMSLLAYAEVAAVSAKSISSAKLIEARAVKDLTALFPEKDVAGLKIEKSVITTVPRNMPFQVMGYSRLMGVLTKHAGEQPPARE
jgi:hypothetical protein